MGLEPAKDRVRVRVRVRVRLRARVRVSLAGRLGIKVEPECCDLVHAHSIAAVGLGKGRVRKS